ADRMAGELADLLDAWQPALLDLVRVTAEAGKALGKPVGVCGAAARAPLLPLVFVGLGITSLSMDPVSIPPVRAALAAHTLAECRGLGTVALDAQEGRVARPAVRAPSAPRGPGQDPAGPGRPGAAHPDQDPAVSTRLRMARLADGFLTTQLLH